MKFCPSQPVRPPSAPKPPGPLKQPPGNNCTQQSQRPEKEKKKQLKKGEKGWKLRNKQVEDAPTSDNFQAEVDPAAQLMLDATRIHLKSGGGSENNDCLDSEQLSMVLEGDAGLLVGLLALQQFYKSHRPALPQPAPPPPLLLLLLLPPLPPLAEVPGWRGCCGCCCCSPSRPSEDDEEEEEEEEEMVVVA